MSLIHQELYLVVSTVLLFLKCASSGCFSCALCTCAHIISVVFICLISSSFEIQYLNVAKYDITDFIFKTHWYLRSEVLMVVNVKSAVLWDMVPCNLVDMYQTCGLHLHGSARELINIELWECRVHVRTVTYCAVVYIFM
jgi:hypothetical protein